MAAALKVFCYSDGFHAWTVAASSRPKALVAWGVERDLFKDGSAKEIRSGPDYEAARKKPGVLIERGLSVDIGKVRSTRPDRSSPNRASAKTRAKIEKLEAALAAMDQAQADEQADLEARRAALEAEAAALGKRQAKGRDQLKAKLKAARSSSD